MTIIWSLQKKNVCKESKLFELLVFMLSELYLDMLLRQRNGYEECKIVKIYFTIGCKVHEVMPINRAELVQK